MWYDRGNRDPSHQSRPRTGIQSAGTCSTFSPQREGRALLRGTYRKENPKDYLIISERRTTNDGPYIPHDFLPCQANLTFDTDNKPNEEQYQRCCLPHPTRLTGSRRRGRWRPPLHSTGHNPSLRGPKRQKSTLTFNDTLGIWEFKGEESPLANKIKEKRLTYHGQCR